MMIHSGFLGIDVSKRYLDIFDGALGRPERIENTVQALEGFAARFAGRDVLVVLEATGHYDEALRRALAAAGVRYSRVNPERARHFAKALGLLAKTDAIDARMLAMMAQALDLKADRPNDPVSETLRRLTLRRDQLVSILQMERTRLAGADPVDVAQDPVVASLLSHIAWLDAEVAAIETAIASHLKTNAELKQKAALLRSIKGIGPVTATILLSRLPELGQLSPGAIAALAGLAPYNVDSGTMKGKRAIRSGRKRVRDALYMAAIAARKEPRFHDFFQRLIDAGKPFKVAIIALARKLLVTANAILRDGNRFSAE